MGGDEKDRTVVDCSTRRTTTTDSKFLEDNDG